MNWFIKLNGIKSKLIDNKNFNKTSEKISYVDFLKFGTVKLIIDNYEIDLVAPRKEVYQDKESRNPTVSYGTLKDDALRRDFTINSMYLDLSSDKIIDPTGKGISDIKNKIIRTTDEDSDKIFFEDPLRMLRAVRQAYQFNFKIDEKTRESIKRNSYRLKIISAERIRDEFLKILKLPNAKSAIKELKELNLLDQFLPELSQAFGVEQDGRYHKETVEEHLLNAVEMSKDDTVDRLVALLHDIGKPATKTIVEGIARFYNHENVSAELAEKIMRRLKFPNNIIKEVTNRIRLHMRPHQYTKEWSDKAIRKFVKDMGEYLEKVLEFAEIDAKSAQSEETEKNISLLNELKDRINAIKSDMAKMTQKIFSGEELMKILNLKPGPNLGKVIEYLKDLQLSNPDITKEEALAKLKEFVENNFKPKSCLQNNFVKITNDTEKNKFKKTAKEESFYLNLLLSFIKKNFGTFENALKELEKFKKTNFKQSAENKKVLYLIGLLALVLGIPSNELLSKNKEEIINLLNQKIYDVKKDKSSKYSLNEIKSKNFDFFKKVSFDELYEIVKSLTKNNIYSLKLNDGSVLELKFFNKKLDTNYSQKKHYYKDGYEFLEYFFITKNYSYELKISKKSEKKITKILFENDNVDINNLNFESFKNISYEKLVEIVNHFGEGQHVLKDGSVLKIIKPKNKQFELEYYQEGLEGKEIKESEYSLIRINLPIKNSTNCYILIVSKKDIQSMLKKAYFPDNPEKKIGNTNMTEKEVWEYYQKNKNKILPYLKGNYVMLKILTDDGKFVIKRNDSKGNPIVIDNEKEYDRWNGGRQEFHITLPEEYSNLAWIDIDPKITKGQKNKLKQKAFEVAVEIKKVLKNNPKLPIKDIKVFDSGGRGFHIFIFLNKKQKIDNVKQILKEILQEKVLPKFKEATFSIPKPDQIRIDLTTFHYLGNIRAPFSLNLKTGKPSVEVS